MHMKLKSILRILPVLLAMLLVLGAAGFTVFAVPGDDNPDNPEVVIDDPEPDPQPEPDPDPEYPTDPIEYTDPVIETDPIIETEPQTEAPEETEPETEEPVTEPIGYIDPTTPDVTEFIPPTLPKTVSEKTYSTNYLAGVVSWGCVLLGVIVILVVLISTKVSGRRANRQQI